MELTEQQQGVINDALKLLEPYNKEDVSSGSVYFRLKNDEETDSEFDCCEKTKCVNKAKKLIRERYGKGTHVEHIWSYNNGDHESIGRCCVCERPLNDGLTWIKYEFDYWKEQKTLSFDEITTSRNAFDICVILNSFPSCDEAMGQYQKHQKEIGNPKPYNDQIKRQKDLIQRVVAFSEKIIKTLKENK